MTTYKMYSTANQGCYKAGEMMMSFDDKKAKRNFDMQFDITKIKYHGSYKVQITKEVN